MTLRGEHTRVFLIGGGQSQVQHANPMRYGGSTSFLGGESNNNARQERPAWIARSRAPQTLGVLLYTLCNCERVNTFHSGNNEALSKSFVITLCLPSPASSPHGLVAITVQVPAVNGLLVERHLGDYAPIQRPTSNKAISLKCFN